MNKREKVFNDLCSKYPKANAWDVIKLSAGVLYEKNKKRHVWRDFLNKKELEELFLYFQEEAEFWDEEPL